MLDRTVANQLADAWWARVRELCRHSTHDHRDNLAGFVIELAGCLCADPFTIEPATTIGTMLTKLSTDPAMISAAAAALIELPSRLRSDDQDDAPERLPLLIAALAQGFTQAIAPRTPSQAQDWFDTVDAALFVCDLKGHFVEVNPAMATLLSRDPAQLRSTSAFEFLHPQDHAGLARRVTRELIDPGHGRLRLELRFTRGDGTFAWLAGTLTLASRSNGLADQLVGFAEDITEQRKRHDELYRQARHDPLTTLPNRLYLGEMIDDAVSTLGPDGRIGMCYLDLDGFKAINDHYGHGVGDQVLAAVAGNLREAAGNLVHVVARLGGDEFVALMTPPVVQERLVAVSHALLDAVGKPISVSGHQIRVSASIGALSTRIGHLDARELLTLADEGLYRAKADTHERICVQYHPSNEFHVPVR